MKQRSIQSPEEVAKIAKAWAEGKAIQLKCIDGTWADRGYSPNNMPNFAENEYRVKPEPLELMAWHNDKTTELYSGRAYTAYSDEVWVKAGFRKIKVREVVD